MRETHRVLNVDIDNFSNQEFLEELKEGVVVTPNVDHLIKLQKDKEFYDVYESSQYRVLDSQILLFLCKIILGKSFKEKIAGSDFFPKFCMFHKDNPDIKIFLLGAMEGIADTAMQKINEKTGREIVIGAHSPSYGFEKNPEENEKILKIINDSGANVILVGVGAPKQEKWIAKYKDRLPNMKIFLGLGATIDFEAGAIGRPPEWAKNMGLEWLHRLLSEPGRLWKRYLIEDMPIFFLLLKQRLGFYKNPFESK